MRLKPFSAPAKMLFSRSFARWRRATDDREHPWELVFDLSRLLSRAYHATPTGVDRVEMAFARELLARWPDQVAFAAVHPAGGYYGRLETGAVRQFLTHVYALWQNGGATSAQAVQRAALRHLIALRPRPVPPRGRCPRIYLQVSPHHLEHQALVASILETEQARFVAFVHDVIPITHPEYARDGELTKHQARMRTVDALADGVLTNSAATLAAICPAHVTERPGRHFGIAHLGWSGDDMDLFGSSAASAAPDHPFFLCIGTIEPRKNHLLLLQLWRRLVERHGAAAPHLVLVGRRGWENENVVDMLERCVALEGVVREERGTSDARMWALMSHARALLLPSFAEGFGMPVSEALAAGAPVICSDLPALREAGGEVPDYLDPLDGLAWLAAIEGYAAPSSPARVAQLDRLRRWRPPTWREHVDTGLALIDKVAENS